MTTTRKRASRAKPQPKPAPATTSDWPRAERPAWFVEPDTDAVARPRRSMFTGEHRTALARVVDNLRSGFFCLPPWQRRAVWTEDQRVRLLDSLVRGMSIGPITLWGPYNGPQARAFPSLPLAPGARFVIDGQQRLTTLAMASMGDLDHWRWNGRAWTTGPGFMTPAIAVQRMPREFLDWSDSVDRATCRRMLIDIDAVADAELTFMTLDGDAATMIETYERLATCGTPHSVADLAVMRRWMEQQA